MRRSAGGVSWFVGISSSSSSSSSSSDASEVPAHEVRAEGSIVLPPPFSLPSPPPSSPRTHPQSYPPPPLPVTRAAYHPITAAIISCAAPRYPFTRTPAAAASPAHRNVPLSSCDGDRLTEETAAATRTHRKSVTFYDQQLTASSAAAALLRVHLECNNSATRLSNSSSSGGGGGGGGGGSGTALEFWQQRLAVYSGAKGGRCRVVLPEPLDL